MGMQLGRVGSLVLGAALAALTFGGARAADIPLKAPTPEPVPYWFPDVPMFGDLILIDTPANIFRGAFKIAENESPRPMDRVYFNYNYFNNVDLGGTKGNVYRETFGFEKTFLNGDASIGVRLPFIALPGRDPGTDLGDIGDVSLIFKYAFINDTTTGNLIGAARTI